MIKKLIWPSVILIVAAISTVAFQAMRSIVFPFQQISTQKDFDEAVKTPNDPMSQTALNRGGLITIEMTTNIVKNKDFYKLSSDSQFQLLRSVYFIEPHDGGGIATMIEQGGEVSFNINKLLLVLIAEDKDKIRFPLPKENELKTILSEAAWTLYKENNNDWAKSREGLQVVLRKDFPQFERKGQK